jgi:hypothetical protein
MVSAKLSQEQSVTHLLGVFVLFRSFFLWFVGRENSSFHVCNNDAALQSSLFSHFAAGRNPVCDATRLICQVNFNYFLFFSLLCLNLETVSQLVLFPMKQIIKSKQKKQLKNPLAFVSSIEEV